MCGMCGWIDFTERPAGTREPVLSAMTDALAHRGPDDRGVWLGRYAGLGHRRLAVLDPAHSRQPMIERTAHGDVVLVYTGETYNFAELRKELSTLGHLFETRGDTEVVLRAYLEWGASCVDRLVGMFSFAIWDAREEKLLLIRDRLGIKPLYYFPTATGVLFGSEPKAILSHPDVRPSIDADGLRQLLGLVRAPGHAVFAGMSEVKPGHLVEVDRAGLRERRYWALESRAHIDDLPTTIATVRSLLSEIVDQQLVADVPMGVLLSGGLDSSTLAAHAQRQSMAAGAGPVRTFSVDFGESPESFVSDAMRGTPDAPYVDAVVRHIGSAHRSVSLSATELLARSARLSALKARDLPMLGEIDTSLLLLLKAVREYVTVAISGEGADELFGGYRWFHDQAVVAQPAFPWLAMARQLGRYSMFEPRGIHLDLVSHQSDLYSDAIREVPALDEESPREARMRELVYLHLTRFLPTPLERKDRMSMAMSLEVRVPFVDHRLIEYVFNVPWSMKSFDGREKSLLRAAARDLLPAQVSAREKSPFPATQDTTYHARLITEVKDMLASGTSTVLSLMNRATVRALASMPPSGAPVVRMGLERVLALHEWIDEYGVSVHA
jgi:asparagine synthase (glutamine-hydrolysing)